MKKGELKLFIDSSSSRKTVVRLGDERLVRSSSIWRSQIVLPMVEKLLKKSGKVIRDIREIRVQTGPGSYTGLRVGAAVANALGYALKVPVNGKRPDKLGMVEPVYD